MPNSATDSRWKLLPMLSADPRSPNSSRAFQEHIVSGLSGELSGWNSVCVSCQAKSWPWNVKLQRCVRWKRVCMCKLHRRLASNTCTRQTEARNASGCEHERSSDFLRLRLGHGLKRGLREGRVTVNVPRSSGNANSLRHSLGTLAPEGSNAIDPIQDKLLTWIITWHGCWLIISASDGISYLIFRCQGRVARFE